MLRKIVDLTKPCITHKNICVRKFKNFAHGREKPNRITDIWCTFLTLTLMACLLDYKKYNLFIPYKLNQYYMNLGLY